MQVDVGQRRRGGCPIGSYSLLEVLPLKPFRWRSLPQWLRMGLCGLTMGCAVAPIGLFPVAWIALAPLWVTVRSLKQGEDDPLQPMPTSLQALQALAKGLSWPAQLMRLIRPTLAWGVGYHGLALVWITYLHPLTWLGIPWLISLAIALSIWLFITLWGAAWVVLWGILCHWLWSYRALRQSRFRRLLTIVIGVAVWSGLEWLWSLGPLFWSSIAYTQSPHNLAILHLGQISGPFTVTAAIVAVNGCWAEAWLIWRRRSRLQTQQIPVPVGISSDREPSTHAPVGQTSHRCPAANPPASAALSPPRRSTHPYQLRGRGQGWTLAGLSLLISLHLLGWSLQQRPLPMHPDTAVHIGIIQGNIPNQVKLDRDGIRLAQERYIAGYTSLVQQGADIVLTPEGALPLVWRDRSQTRSPIYQVVAATGIPLWLGTFRPVAGSNKITQSLITLTGQPGDPVSQYNKTKLVPLGEYVPLENLLGKVISRISAVGYGMAPGNYRQVFDTPIGRAAVGICYESAFPSWFQRQVHQGAEFILTASNNDPYPTFMMQQHHALDVMRAVEHRRWMVRGTNTGISGVVSPRGETQWQSQRGTVTTHLTQIHRLTEPTLYTRWGNWLTPLLLGLASVSLGWLGWQMGV